MSCCLQGVSEPTKAAVEAAQRSHAATAAKPSPELEDVLVLERLIWQTLDSIVVLAARAKRVVREVLLPPPILQLRPRSLSQDQPAGGSPLAASPAREASSTEEAGSTSSSGRVPDRDAHAESSSSEGAEGSEAAGQQLHADELYPPLRRAQRLAYSLATVLQESFDHAEGRQVHLYAVHHFCPSACHFKIPVRFLEDIYFYFLCLGTRFAGLTSNQPRWSRKIKQMGEVQIWDLGVVHFIGKVCCAMQAVLEARTTSARLKLILEVLLEQRNRLQALAALRVAGEGS